MTRAKPDAGIKVNDAGGFADEADGTNDLAGRVRRQRAGRLGVHIHGQHALEDLFDRFPC